MFHVIVNANSTVQHVIHIKNGITKHANMSVKIVVRDKKIINGILANVFGRMVRI